MSSQSAPTLHLQDQLACLVPLLLSPPSGRQAAWLLSPRVTLHGNFERRGVSGVPSVGGVQRVEHGVGVFCPRRLGWSRRGCRRPDVARLSAALT